MPVATSDRRLRILLVDDHVPYPELGVGYPRARRLLHALHGMGHAVVLAPTEPCADRLARLHRVVPAGVEVVPGLAPAAFGRFLADRAGAFDLLLVSRPDNLRRVLSVRPGSWREVPILYDAEALWATRSALQRAVEGSPLTAAQADRLLQDEVDLAREAAHVVAVNETEACVFRERGCASVGVLGDGVDPTPTPRAWADRRDLLFVGALDDEPSPNVDALTWFVREVMPLLASQRTPPWRLLVAGRKAAAGVRALAGPRVLLLGPLQDLTDLYDRARVFVAPHRYAAGLPTKVLEAAAHGLPCVATALLAGQLDWQDGRQLLCAGTPAQFAAAVTRLDGDPAAWDQVRRSALADLSQRFSPPGFAADLARALALAMRARPAAPMRRPAASAAALQPLAPRTRRGWSRWAGWLPRRVGHAVDAWRIARCAAFDRDWYLTVNADVAAAGADPAMHYLLYGAAEGRDPGPGFSTMGYLSRHPEAARDGRNPLLHFVDVGAAQGWSAAPREQGTAPVRRVVFVIGEPGTAGVELRVDLLTEAMAANGALVSALTIAEATRQPQQVSGASMLVLWRTAWDESVAGLVRLARQGGACVLFDADDLVIEPEAARVELIDGIRSQRLTEAEVRGYFERTLRAFEAADAASCSTEELASHMRRRGKPVFVVPNGYGDQDLRRSRLAARRRQALADATHVRIGYAAGTRTHQRDFALVAGALAEVLRRRPQCRLVLFRGHAGQALVDLDEHPVLAGLEPQIEWRRGVAPEHLAEELARFDINIAPVETGNPFCEAKSELKFVHAALVGVCTVASPTGPFARAIDHGRSGFLATHADEWCALLLQLVDDPALRSRVGEAAHRQVLWPHGPRRRAELAAAMLDQMLAEAPLAARSGALQLCRAAAPRPPAPVLPEARVVYAADRLGQAEVTVVVPLYDYARYIGEALDSVAAQTLAELDLVVVDDASGDDSLQVACTWVERHARRFNRVVVLQHRANAGLGPARNSAIDRAETPFVLTLDADDRLLPAAGEKLLAAMQRHQADFAYPLVQQFGDGGALVGKAPYRAQRFVGGNFISAIALIRKECWAAVGGYAHIDLGWEDYDFWCRFVEQGLWGQQVPEVLAEYRVHGDSMTRRRTEPATHKQALAAELRRRHPWLSLPAPTDPNLG